MATTYTSTTGSAVNDARIGFGAGVSSTERAAASAYSRNSQATMQTASALVSDRPMTTLDNSDAAVSQFDIVSMDSDGFTVSWAVTDSYITPYLALGNNNITTKVGYFDLTTGAGTQDITTGAEPKLVILFTATTNTTEGGHAAAYFSYGVADADGGVFSMASFDGDAIGTSSSYRYLSSAHAFTQINSSAVIAQISTVTMLSNGFRVTKSTAPSSNLRIGYVAIGGRNFAAKVTNIVGPGSARSVSYTGIGFQPDSFIFLDPALIPDGSREVNSHIGIGFADGTANNAAVSCLSKGLAPNSATRRRLSLTDCILTMNLLSSGFANVRARANLTSADSDGFTLNWSTTDGSPRTYGVVAISTEGPIEPGQLVLAGATDINFAVVGNITISLDIAPTLTLASGEDLSFGVEDAEFTEPAEQPQLRYGIDEATAMRAKAHEKLVRAKWAAIEARNQMDERDRQRERDKQQQEKNPRKEQREIERMRQVRVRQWVQRLAWLNNQTILDGEDLRLAIEEAQANIKALMEKEKN